MMILIRTIFVITMTFVIAGAAVEASEDIKMEDSPYFELSIAEKNQLIERLRTIKLGDSWETVKNILGDPDLEYEIGPKESLSTVGVERVYFVYRSSRLANIKDKMIRLYFDKEQNMKHIYSNIDGYILDEGGVY